ncbi:hypothetical protein [Streptomyces sp. NPDC101150]|uniref:RapZ C-terminal domain-containing protein n=1 Tax=Streptomyces sp. NPDC101150 TaxID=3366114 RepID=UPI00381BF749
MPDVFIDSFSARRQDAPPPRYRAAVLGINLTDALLNPPDDPALADVVARQTGRDAGVRDYVLNTPGASRIIDDAVHEFTALRTAAHGRPVQLLVNCWYGRHRVVDRTTQAADQCEVRKVVGRLVANTTSHGRSATPQLARTRPRRRPGRRSGRRRGGLGSDPVRGPCGLRMPARRPAPGTVR